MAIITVENFELEIKGVGDGLQFKSVDLPAYKTDVQHGDALMSGAKGSVRQTLTKKREAAVQITLVTLASGDAKSTSSLMRKWLLQCMPKAEDGGGFPTSARMAEGVIKAYNSAGEMVDSWKMSGIWICKYEIGKLSADGGLLDETFRLHVDQFDPA